MRKSYKFVAFVLVVVLASFLLDSCAGTRNRKDETYVLGKNTWDNWKTLAKWQSYEAADYSPNDFMVNQITEITNSGGFKYVLFAGSWCGDSKTEVPKIYKLLGNTQQSIELIGVDRDKVDPEGLHKIYKITNVPTLIILKNGKEIDRIVEFPKKSWEEDLFGILTK